MTKYFFIFLVLVSCNNKPVQDKNKERIDAVCDKIMQNFSKQDIPKAMQLIKDNTNTISPLDIDTLQYTIIEQFKNGTFSGYGEIHSAELILERKLNNFASRKYYALRFKKYFLKFVITIYNGGSGWKITSFKYNEDFSDLF